MKNVVIAVIALALIAVAFLLGRRSVKPEIVEIHRTDTVVVRDTVRETVLVPKIRYLTQCRYGTFACSGRYGQGSGTGPDFPKCV